MMRLWPCVEPSAWGGSSASNPATDSPRSGGLPGDGGAHRAESDDGEVDLLIGHGAAS